MIKFRVTGYKERQKDEVIPLSWIQKLVCRLFNIVPLKLYNYVLEIDQVDMTASGWDLVRGSWLVAEDGSQWLVIDRLEYGIVIKSTRPLQDYNIKGYMNVLGYVQPEGRING